MNDSTLDLEDKKKYIKPVLEKASDHSKNEIVKVIMRKQTFAEKVSSTLDDLLVHGKIISSQPEPIAEKIKKERKPLVRLRFRAEDFEDVE